MLTIEARMISVEHSKAKLRNMQRNFQMIERNARHTLHVPYINSMHSGGCTEKILNVLISLLSEEQTFRNSYLKYCNVTRICAQ